MAAADPRHVPTSLRTAAAATTAAAPPAGIRLTRSLQLSPGTCVRRSATAAPCWAPHASSDSGWLLAHRFVAAAHMNVPLLRGARCCCVASAPKCGWWWRLAPCDGVACLVGGTNFAFADPGIHHDHQVCPCSQPHPPLPLPAPAASRCSHGPDANVVAAAATTATTTAATTAAATTTAFDAAVAANATATAHAAASTADRPNHRHHYHHVGMCSRPFCRRLTSATSLERR